MVCVGISRFDFSSLANICPYNLSFAPWEKYVCSHAKGWGSAGGDRRGFISDGEGFWR